MARDEYEKQIRLMGGEALEELRRHEREAKRRQRAKRYAAGLDASGRPITTADAQRRADVRREFTPHPTDCCCYDCLYGDDVRDVLPVVVRVAGGRA